MVQINFYILYVFPCPLFIKGTYPTGKFFTNKDSGEGGGLGSRYGKINKKLSVLNRNVSGVKTVYLGYSGCRIYFNIYFILYIIVSYIFK